jgi:hypothetical protein
MTEKLDKLATDVDDAFTIVEELRDDPARDTEEKLDEVHETLTHASETLEKLEDEDETSD